MTQAVAREVCGWREWIRLPRLDVPSIKAKVDTGARTSSLHAWNIEEYSWRGREMVRFELHPEQRSSKHAVTVEAPLAEKRHVRPSTGSRELRPVILTTIELGRLCWEVEITLTDRDTMGFRMLLGRQALRGRFLVDPGRSFVHGRRIRGSRRIKRK